MALPLWKAVWHFLKKLNIIPYDPAISLLDIDPKEMKTRSPRDICTHMFTAALLTTVKTWEQPKGPLTDEWIKKM